MYCVNVPPDADREENLSRLAERLIDLRSKYIDLRMFFYGDLSTKREEMENSFIKVLTPYGYKVHNQLEWMMFTRSQSLGVKRDMSFSYFDHYVTLGIEKMDFNISDRFLTQIISHWRY